jgi:hypothetical protein
MTKLKKVLDVIAFTILIIFLLIAVIINYFIMFPIDPNDLVKLLEKLP